jgi:hypothetical protein
MFTISMLPNHTWVWVDHEGFIVGKMRFRTKRKAQEALAILLRAAVRLNDTCDIAPSACRNSDYDIA